MKNLFEYRRDPEEYDYARIYRNAFSTNALTSNDFTIKKYYVDVYVIHDESDDEYNEKRHTNNRPIRIFEVNAVSISRAIDEVYLEILDLEDALDTCTCMVVRPAQPNI